MNRTPAAAKLDRCRDREKVFLFPLIIIQSPKKIDVLGNLPYLTLVVTSPNLNQTRGVHSPPALSYIRGQELPLASYSSSCSSSQHKSQHRFFHQHRFLPCWRRHNNNNNNNLSTTQRAYSLCHSRRPHLSIPQNSPKSRATNNSSGRSHFLTLNLSYLKRYCVPFTPKLPSGPSRPTNEVPSRRRSHNDFSS